MGPRGRGRGYATGPLDKGTLLRVFKYVFRDYSFALLFVAVLIGISAYTHLQGTLFMQKLIDIYILPMLGSSDTNFAPLAGALGTLAVIYLIGIVAGYLRSIIMAVVAQGSLEKMRNELFRKMQTLPIRYFDTHERGNIMSVFTNDIDTTRQVIGQTLPQVLESGFTIAMTLTSMIRLSIPLTLVSVVMAVVMMIATTQLGKRSRNYFRTQQQRLARVNGFIEEMMTGQKVVKIFCHEGQAIREFEEINEQLRSSACSANRMANIVMPVNGGISNFGFVLLAVVGATLAIYQFSIFNFEFSITLGTVVAFLQLNKSFTRPISQVSQQINSVLNASVGAERVFALGDAEPEMDEGKVELKDPKGDVDFTDVDFGYTAEKQVLFDIDINTNPGQKIAFVGGTGAGKTTIINLINRFYEIQEGKILYDGIPITDISKQSLRKGMSIVLQETHLFTGTVLDNIRYGKLDATDEECVKAARLVGADDFIRRLANGYQTVLNGDGGNLSQGERQLLAIARAAVSNPPVLILDEATSSIDTRTETLVQKGMDTLMKGRTTFVIAHRLSTVRNADQIIVLDHGRIIEQGTHEQLLAMKGRYHQLYTGHELTK